MTRPRSLVTMLIGFVAACGAAPVSPDGGTTTRVSGSETTGVTDGTSSSSSSSESGSTDTETSTDPDTDPTVGFLDGYDYADSGSGCDPFAQDCPDGEKCTAYDQDGEPPLDNNKCVPVLGDGSAGQPCTWDGPQVATDDCDAASACYFVADRGNDTQVGTCTPFCQGTGDEPSCPDMLVCYLGAKGAPVLCVPTCDPLMQDCADPNAVCHWSEYAFTFSCLQRGVDQAVGQPCADVTDCAAGGLCLDADLVPGCADAACCGSLCELGMPGGCDSLPGTSCVSFFLDPVPPGYELIGVCL